MSASFYFYDLETSGFNPREARIMQFAGQRTDLDLKPIGEPHNFFIKLSDDVLPDPEAILVTGITPQKVNQEGLTEAEFLKIFQTEISKPNTIFVGFNSVRFDDEFMRFLNYRNFYDPYEWQWQDGRSRWDLLDLARMTRALRPEGIKWPFAPDGKPSNSLGLITAINKLKHQNAHDALGDVMATIEVASMLQKNQPKLFDFLLTLRDKKRLEEFVHQNKTFVYTSGKYSSEFEKTTVVTVLAKHPTRQGVLVYDLRHDPSEFIDLSVEDIAVAWKRRWNEEGLHLPIKTLQFNRCPAVAPISVLDAASKDRIELSMVTVEANRQKLNAAADFADKVLKAQELLDKKQQANLLVDERLIDEQLYDGFFDNADKKLMTNFRAAAPGEVSNFSQSFKDQRLNALVPLYKARNYPNELTDEERAVWERYRATKLLSGNKKSRAASFFERLEQAQLQPGINKDQKFALEDLKLYAESIIPVE